jgi:predicted SnoaL-like aldol condensation-catalyzing enzyme
MNNKNKQLILDFYSKVLSQGDENFANRVIDENYIQHNPMVKTGKSGFLNFLSFLKQIPQPKETKAVFKRVIADESFVVVHSQIEFMGKENATVDMYRIENNVLMEHWDTVQIIENERPIVEGSIDINLD